MKTVIVLHSKTEIHHRLVKNHLITGIIYLTSQNLFTFVAIVSSLIACAALIIGSERLMAIGALLFLTGFAPWSLRRVRRDMRQDRLGLKNW